MRVKVGERLSCVGCATEVIVVRAPAGELEITCGGDALVAGGEDARGNGTVAREPEAGTLLGKRYADVDSGLELLCTRSGAGTLEAGGTPLAVKQAKSLPSSD